MMSKTQDSLTKIYQALFEGNQVRIVGTADEPLFVAKDVCAILELKNSNQHVRDLDAEDVSEVYTIYPSSNGAQQRRAVSVVTESGLYALIFKSRKPQARAFKKWICSELLPQLRRQGYYVSAGMDPLLARVERGEVLLEEAQRLEKKAATLKREAASLLSLEGQVTVRAFAREHGIETPTASLKAAAFAKKHAVPIGRIRRGGKAVSTYPVDVLREAFDLNQRTMTLN